MLTSAQGQGGLQHICCHFAIFIFVPEPCAVRKTHGFDAQGRLSHEAWGSEA